MSKRLTKGLEEIRDATRDATIRRWHIMLFGGLVGISSFFILPSAFKFFGFIVPIIAFSMGMRDSRSRFNIHVFLVCLFIFVLGASNMVTFDASKSYDIEKLMGYVETGGNVLTIILGFGVPLLLILSGLFALIMGKALEGVKAIFVAILIIAITLVVSFAMNLAGFDNLVTDWIMDFYTEVFSWMFEMPIQLYEGVAQGLGNLGMGLDLPMIPENKHFRSPDPAEKTEGGLFGTNFSTGVPMFDGVSSGVLGGGGSIVDVIGGGTGGGLAGGLGGNIVEDLSGGIKFDVNDDMEYTETVYAIHDAMPVIAGMMCIVSALFFRSKKGEKLFEDWIDRLTGVKRKPKKIRRHLPHADYFLMGYGIFLLFAGFFVFLGYTHAYGYDRTQDWKFIMFIYYALMCFVSIYFLQRFHNYTRSNIINTFKGTIYGLIGLFFLTRMFLSYNCARAFSTVEMHSNGMYALNTFIFIAPAETLAFTLLFSSFVIAVLQRYATPLREEYVQEDIYAIPRRIKDLEEKVEMKHDDIQIWKSLHGAVVRDKKKKTRKLNTHRKVAEINAEISQFNKKIRALKKIEVMAYTGPESIVGRPVYLVIFIVCGVILSSFVFASAHWIIMADEIDYATFWLSGLAIIYFSGNCWFIYVGYKWGWFSAIMVHAIYNTSTILMVIIFTA